MLFSDPQQAPVQTRPSQYRDYPQWHHGRSRYAVWLLMIEDAAVLRRHAALSAQLRRWLLPGATRQPHLTLAVAGFLDGQQEHDDDACPNRLQQLGQWLRQSPPRAPRIAVAGLDSFASAAFLRVDDPHDDLGTLHGCLKQADDFRQGPYVPHITLGLYRRQLSAGQVQQRIRHYQSLPGLPLTCHELCLASYAAQRAGGPLRIEQRFALQMT